MVHSKIVKNGKEEGNLKRIEEKTTEGQEWKEEVWNCDVCIEANKRGGDKNDDVVEYSIDAAEIMRGDLVLVTANQVSSFDCIIISDGPKIDEDDDGSNAMQIDRSNIMPEGSNRGSIIDVRSAPLGDKNNDLVHSTNTVLAGDYVIKGCAWAVVTAVKKNTYIIRTDPKVDCDHPSRRLEMVSEYMNQVNKGTV